MNDTTTHTEPVWAALQRILDPEFGVSIVDLGLIYSVEWTAGEVRVVMTLTTPTCPAGGWIVEGAENAVREVPGVKSVRTELVFDPAWTPAMLSADGRRQLGWTEVER